MTSRSPDEIKLAHHNSRFTYQSDEGKFIDDWKIVKHTDAFEGDCEDYSLALLWMLSNGSFWTFWWNVFSFKGVVWFCKTRSGGGHAMLRWKGQWVDNIFPYYRKEPMHKAWFPYILPLMILKLILASIARKFRK